jgi:adenosylcobinamide-GDP ribazoletransferase
VTPAGRRLRDVARGPLAAVAFLTSVPVGRFAVVDATAVAAAAPFYPLVGAGLGAFAALVERGLSPSLPAFVVAALLLALLAGLTGAIHLDALADTADALGGRTREDRLRIMRDHHIGAFGATALVLALSLKLAAIAALIELDEATAGLVLAAACSRAAVLPVAALLPDARRDERTTSISGQVGVIGAAAGLLVAAALAVLVSGLAGCVVLITALAVAGLAAAFYAWWLRGVTGDALGAVVELAELSALTTAVAVL